MTIERLIEGLVKPRSLLCLTPRTWEEILGYARTSQVLARLALGAESAHCLDDIPPGPRRHLAWARTSWAAQVRGIRWDIDSIGRALAGVDTPVVLLKGAAYLMAGLPPAHGRTFGDIDIMVRRDRLDAVEAALAVQHWRMHDVDAYDQHYYRTWMHELPPMQHVLRRTMLDVHHTIAPPTARHRIDAAGLFAAASPLAVPGRFMVLAPTDMLLHAVLHLMQEGEFERGLRDLIDVDLLFRHFGRDAAFWPALVARTRGHRLERPLYYAVRQTRRLFDTPMPTAFLAEVRRFAPPAPARAAMNAIFDAGIACDPPRERQLLSRFSRGALYVRGHFLRMPLTLLMPHLAHKMLRRMWSA